MLQGETVTPHNMSKYYPLVYAGDVVTTEVPKTAIAGFVIMLYIYR